MAASPDARTASVPRGPPTAQPQSRRRWKLPVWLNHFNAHDGKVVFRCWVAVWVATLLVFIQPALNNIGLATFFASLVLFIVPPASIVFIYLLAALSLLLGMCLAWAWGLLTMKAALAARPESETQRALQALQQAAGAQAKQTGKSVSWEAQALIHEGFMLDVRVTAVFYVMAAVFIYALARIRLTNPKFTLLQLFGTIITDLFLLIGPTLPSFNADLGSVLVKPGAIGIGLGAACCLLLFPHSTSYAVLDKMEKLIRLEELALNTTKRRLKGQFVSLEELAAAKSKTMALYKSMEPALAFLPLDMSRGRWNAEDVERLHGPVRETMLASLSIIDFHIARIDAVNREEQLDKHQVDGEKSHLENSGIGLHQIQESADLITALRSPEQGDARERTRQAILETTTPILQVCSDSIQIVAKCINTVNTRRWVGQPQQQTFDELAQELEMKLAALQTTRGVCIRNTTERVLQSHEDLFDEHGRLKPPGKRGAQLLRGIVVAMVIEERIVGLTNAIEKLLDMTLHLTSARKSHRIWLPYRLRYAFTWLFDGRLSVPVSGTTTDPADDPHGPASPILLQDKAAEACRRLRASRGGIRPNPRSSVTRAMASTYKWLTNPGGMYALRMVIVTIVTSTPAAIPHSAGFFYREKGIWGVISAQTCLLVYMADFTFSVVSRGVGTVVGGVMGMIAWYIGSGSGIGNPYGLGAISALMVLILVWLRIFLPPAFAQAGIMAGATFALVIGFSYDHQHIVQYGLPGVGYEAFWKRLVTVLLGFTASCVVQLFPKPPSATNHVCQTLGETISTLADHYALLLSHWGLAEQQSSPLNAVAEQISLNVADTLLSLDGALSILKIEASFGPFDQHSLREAQRLSLTMNQSLGRLLDLSSSLSKELQDRFTITVGFLDDHVIGDIMAVLGVIGMSFTTGAPLPERLPAPLIRNFYTWWHAQHRTAMLNTTLVRDENYRRYCVAVSAYLRFLTALDDLVLVVKGAVGECHVVRQWDDV
ncbi:hypothetical protein QQS21_006828 [Conoideocrella luteorostrata]|uniref:ER transporter 6TM N-terminal domain-containing protein n=1 Tax=Conoideocrella luteorostrata TaxID=1105319 RepID=A0AAJ0CP99_9HYPO|nr:hypothetical protein QQS21_006828 [Conoideocrella luteorostrata]